MAPQEVLDAINKGKKEGFEVEILPLKDTSFFTVKLYKNDKLLIVDEGHVSAWVALSYAAKAISNAINLINGGLHASSLTPQ